MRTSPRAVLFVVVPVMLLMVIAADMVNLVLPLIGARFHASAGQLAWVVTGFLLVFSVGIPFYGRIADRISLRRLFGLALLLYAAGSLCCALAPSLLVLVLGRLLTGAGAAAIPVLSILAITRVLPARQRGTGIGFVSAAGGVGTALGPAVGGVLGQFVGWSGLFWCTLAAALVLLPAALRILPDETPGDANPFDIAGGAFLGAGAGLLLLGITQGQVAGFGAAVAWGPLVGAALAFAVFGRRTATQRHPFVPRALFAHRRYLAAAGTVFLTMAAYLATLVFVPVLLVDVQRVGLATGALLLLPGGVAVAALSPVVGRLAARVPARSLVHTGLAVAAAGTLLLSTVAGRSALLAALGVLLLSVGFALVITTVTNAAAGSLPAGQAGVGLGIFQGAQFLGAGTGPALIGTFLAARQAAGAPALLSPTSPAPAFSDTFLLLTAVLVAAALTATALPARHTPAPIP